MKEHRETIVQVACAVVGFAGVLLSAVLGQGPGDVEPWRALCFAFGMFLLGFATGSLVSGLSMERTEKMAQIRADAELERELRREQVMHDRKMARSQASTQAIVNGFTRHAEEYRAAHPTPTYEDLSDLPPWYLQGFPEKKS